MKINFDNFEIEVKAKDPVTGKYSKETTMFLLNRISVLYMEAARWEQGQGLQVVSKEYNNASDEIYRVLKENGFYDD